MQKKSKKMRQIQCIFLIFMVVDPYSSSTFARFESQIM